MSEIQQQRPRIAKMQMDRLGRLLDMMYTPNELAEELQVDRRTIYRSYLPAGCPFERDENNRYWINGEAFARWARAVMKKRKKYTFINDRQAWCMSCRQVVETVLVDGKVLRTGVVIKNGECPECGRRVYRYFSRKNK